MSTEIHTADALEIIGDLGEFDAVITDPPYATGGELNMKDPQSILEAREMVDGLCQSLVAGVLRGVRRRKGVKFSVWMMTDWRQVSFFSAILRGLGLPSQSSLIWDKGSGSMSPLYHTSYEMILYATERAQKKESKVSLGDGCLLYTSPSPRD